MDQDAALHGSEPSRHKITQGEGNYASSMSTDIIVTRSDQGLTLPHKIPPPALLDNSQTPGEFISEVCGGMTDGISKQKSKRIGDDLEKETVSRTRRTYGPCQHINAISHQAFRRLTDEQGIPVEGLNQRDSSPFSQATGPAEKMAMEHSTTSIQSVSVPTKRNRDSAKQSQLSRHPERFDGIRFMKPTGISMPVSSNHAQTVKSQGQQSKDDQSKDDGVALLHMKVPITSFDGAVPFDSLAALPCNTLPRRYDEHRSQAPITSFGGPATFDQLAASPSNTLSRRYDEDGSQAPTLLRLSSMAEDLRMSKPVCVNPRRVENKRVEKTTGNTLATEQLHHGIHTLDPDVPLQSVEAEAELGQSACPKERSHVSEGKGIKTRLYSSVYGLRSADASPGGNYAIDTTIRNESTAHLNSAEHPPKSPSHLLNSGLQLFFLESLIATAPMAPSEMDSTQRLISAAIKGEIVLERDLALEALLEPLHKKMATNKQFRNGVIAFFASKKSKCLDISITGQSLNKSDIVTTRSQTVGNQADSSGQNHLFDEAEATATSEITATAEEASQPKFNLKTCKFNELKAEYRAVRTQAHRDKARIEKLVSKRNLQAEKEKNLTRELHYLRGVIKKVPINVEFSSSQKWQCRCGIYNTSWADGKEFAPGKIPKDWRVSSQDSGIPSGAMNQWAHTHYCRLCGRNNLVGHADHNAESAHKRKSQDIEVVGLEDSDGEEGPNKRHRKNGYFSHQPEDAMLNFHAHLGVFRNSSAGAPVSQSPMPSEGVVSMHHDEYNDLAGSQEFSPEIGGSMINQFEGDGEDFAFENEFLSAFDESAIVLDNGDTASAFAIGDTSPASDGGAFFFDNGDATLAFDNGCVSPFGKGLEIGTLSGVDAVTYYSTDTIVSLSSHQAAVPTTSRPSPTDNNGRQSSEESELIPYISQADLDLISSMGNHRSPAKPIAVSVAPSGALGLPRQARHDSKAFDIRGNQVRGSCGLPTSRHHKARPQPPCSSLQSAIGVAMPTPRPTGPPQPNPWSVPMGVLTLPTSLLPTPAPTPPDAGFVSAGGHSASQSGTTPGWAWSPQPRPASMGLLRFPEPASAPPTPFSSAPAFMPAGNPLPPRAASQQPSASLSASSVELRKPVGNAAAKAVTAPFTGNGAGLDAQAKQAEKRSAKATERKRVQVPRERLNTLAAIDYSLGVRRRSWEEPLPEIPKTLAEQMREQAEREPVIIPDDTESEVSEEE